jgi:hypothetical protein
VGKLLGIMGLRVIVLQLNDGQAEKVDASNEAFSDFTFPNQFIPIPQNTSQLSVPNLQPFDLSWRAKAQIISTRPQPL